jgi:hypothetical protein
VVEYIKGNKADCIGWVGTAGFMIGSLLLAYYLYQGKWAKLPSLITISVVLIAFNGFAIYKWLY